MDELSEQADTSAATTPGPASVGNEACVRCRKGKIKCKNSGGSEPCQRCARLKVECEYFRHKRGRKTNEERAARRASSSSVPYHTRSDSMETAPRRYPSSRPQDNVASSNAYHPTSNTRTTVDVSLISQSRQPPSNQQHYQQPVPTPPAPTPRRLLTDASPQGGPPTNSSTTWSPHSIAQPIASIDVSRILDPANPDVGEVAAGHSSFIPSRGYEGRELVSEEAVQCPTVDPVSLGFLSIYEAELLYNRFFDNLNPITGLFDDQLHTLAYIRKTSSTLFTSLLTVSSKFFLHSLYSQLLHHSQTIVNREMNSGTCNLELIQSLLLLTYWKAPNDVTVWFKLGAAIRMGYQLRLHVKSREFGSLPEDEYQARLVLNAERTWYNLACFDWGYSEIFSLPCAINRNHILDAESWAKEHQHLSGTSIPEDYHIAFSLEGRKENEHLVGVIASGPPSEALARVFDNLEYNRAVGYSKWFEVDPELLPAKTREIMRAYYFNRTFKIYRARLKIYPSQRLTTECISLANKVTQQVCLLSEQGCLAYIHDVLSTVLADMGTFFSEIFHDLDPYSKAQVIQQMRKIHTACLNTTNQAQGKSDHAPAFISRFFARLLRGIDANHRSRATTPTGGPMTYTYSNNHNNSVHGDGVGRNTAEGSSHTSSGLSGNPNAMISGSNGNTVHNTPIPILNSNPNTNSGDSATRAAQDELTREIEEFLASIDASGGLAMDGPLSLDQQYWSSLEASWPMLGFDPTGNGLHPPQPL